MFALPNTIIVQAYWGSVKLHCDAHVSQYVQAAPLQASELVCYALDGSITRCDFSSTKYTIDGGGE